MSFHNHDEQIIKTNFPGKKRLTAKERKESKEKAAAEKSNAEKRRVLEFIGTFGEFTDAEKELIFEINGQVMGVDGTAEGWGGYSYEPTEYVETSIEIFKLSKLFFTGIGDDVFGIGDQVETPFGPGEVWKITSETIHVKHPHFKDGKDFLFSKYHFNPYHHTQRNVSELKKQNDHVKIQKQSD